MGRPGQGSLLRGSSSSRRTHVRPYLVTCLLFCCCPFNSCLILKFNRMAEIILIWLRQFFVSFSAVRYHFTPVRLAIIKKSTKNNCWRGCGEKGTLLHCCWERKLVQQLGRTVWLFLKKLKIELPYDPAVLLLVIYLEKTIM